VGEACCTGGACGSGCCDPIGVKCVAAGAACTSGGTCSGGTCPPVTTGSCATGQGFPTFTKACTNTMSCSFGLHTINCCGTQMALGFNHDQRDAFTAAETAWDATCPQCGCPQQPLTAEDGKSCTMQMITVTCDNSICTTHCP
jgi:hypothetical protein